MMSFYEVRALYARRGRGGSGVLTCCVPLPFSSLFYEGSLVVGFVALLVSRSVCLLSDSLYAKGRFSCANFFLLSACVPHRLLLWRVFLSYERYLLGTV